MRISVLAVGRRQPDWIESAVNEYRRRLPPELQLRITEIAAARRGRNDDRDRVLQEEGRRILAALPDPAHIVILDERGQQPDSRGIADHLDDWRHDHRHVAFVIGGAEGLDRQVRKQAAETWSLSRLTLPHGIVRVLLLEQLYRAWSILNNHPYHRD